MVAGKPEMLEGSAVRAQLVSRHRLRREALLAEQLAHELDGCAFIPSALNKDFKNLAFIIDRAPQVHMLAGDPDDHLVEMPAIARPRTAAPQPSCDNWPEFHPARRLAVPAFHPELPRCGGASRRARDRCLVRDGAQLGAEISGGICLPFRVALHRRSRTAARETSRSSTARARRSGRRGAGGGWRHSIEGRVSVKDDAWT